MSEDHTYEFNVTMSCGGCSGAIKRVLGKLDGMFCAAWIPLRPAASAMRRATKPIQPSLQPYRPPAISSTLSSPALRDFSVRRRLIL
jgi:copper chaperone CopZ